MNIESLVKELSENTYPGRGIVIGKSKDGFHAVIAYFIMGRSENSRNRIFADNDRGGIQTKAFDESKMEDPSLIIYHPVVRYADANTNVTIVTNGDQTENIYDACGTVNSKDLMLSLRAREFEPDMPNYTPRISGVLYNNDGSYSLSILKSNMGNPECLRFFYEYPGTAGLGHFIHTYKCDGNPIPSFEGEPTPVEIDGDIDEFTQMIWDNLNEDNKVSLFTRFVNLKTGEESTRVINKNA